jgi:hypothetical protein
MALKPKEEIGMEMHKLDQFFRVEEGTGEAILNGVRTVISAGFAVLVCIFQWIPAGKCKTNRLPNTMIPARECNGNRQDFRKNWNS